MADTTERLTVELPADLLARVDEAIRAGRVGSRDDAVAAALRRELAAMERAEIDASFEGIAEDAEYQAEAEQISKEFARADWETWRLTEQDQAGMEKETNMEEARTDAKPPITETQERYLRLMEQHQYNLFDGERVVADLRAHRDLWEAAVMWRSMIGIILRDLPGDFNNVDTLYLSTTPDRLERLKALAETWDADEVAVDEEIDFGVYPSDLICLGVWWD
jgi:Arc/MetJ-type ribon-helix-helix transcriptional regulator